MTAVAALSDRPAADRSIVLELARIEGVRLLLHPAFLVGCAASALVRWPYATGRCRFGAMKTGGHRPLPA